MSYASLPDDGEVMLAGVHLPAGQRVSGFTGDVLAWATDEPVREAGAAWFTLSAAHRQTGLIPVVLAGLDGDTSRPWDNGEFDAPYDVTQLDQLPAERVLAACWAGALEDDGAGDDRAGAGLAPFGRRFPGLAAPETAALGAEQLRTAVDAIGPARIGLVPAGRPADVLPRLGWSGVVNWFDSPLPVAAVLRSWEDRFGARLLEVGFADIKLLVERPPRSLAAAEQIAAEHYVFCDECGAALTGIRSIAASLVSAPIWSFWWD